MEQQEANRHAREVLEEPNRNELTSPAMEKATKRVLQLSKVTSKLRPLLEYASIVRAIRGHRAEIS